jgi:hypothetical protein
MSEVIEERTIEDILHTHPDVEVVFTKVDGSERVMHCTLMESLIPPSGTPQVEIVPGAACSTARDTAIRVWDIDKQAWRSFRRDSVISVFAQM